MNLVRKIKCLSYKALDKFRFTKVASVLFYHGRDVVIVSKNFATAATLISDPSNAEDGDITFNVKCDDGHEMHIELTPCSPQSLVDKVKLLRAGDRRYFQGERRTDPAHGNSDLAKDEIHPLEDILD